MIRGWFGCHVGQGVNVGWLALFGWGFTGLAPGRLGLEESWYPVGWRNFRRVHVRRDSPVTAGQPKAVTVGRSSTVTMLGGEL